LLNLYPEETAPLKIELTAFCGRNLPNGRRLGEFVLKSPSDAIKCSEKLDMAGNPGASIRQLLRTSFQITLGLIVLALQTFKQHLRNRGFIAIPAAILGFYLPDLLLKAKTDRRQMIARRCQMPLIC
jgi:hypothetical protein